MSNWHYKAKNRVQITTLDGKHAAEAVHEDHDGTPLCNQQLQTWWGLPLTFTSLGAGVVTCGNCARCR